MDRKEKRVLLGAAGLLLLAAGALAFAVIGGHVDVTRSAATDRWCGLEVAPEDRCSVYDRRRDYRYPADIERDIAAAAGHRVDPDGRISPPFPSPYVPGVTFGSIRETDIEHIVAAAEAHDSGLCAASAEIRGGVCERSAEPDAGVARSEPAPEVGPGRGRVAAGDQSAVVRGAGRSGQAPLRAFRGPRGAGRPSGGSRRMSTAAEA